MRIDSHVHFWNIDRYASGWMTGRFAPLKRTFLPADLEPLLQSSRFDAAIFVQAQHEESDNEFVLRLAETHPWIVGVVGWVDLTATDLPQRLERWRAWPRFCGVRHITHDEPDPNWIVREDVGRGLAALERMSIPFDLLFRPEHLHHVSALMKRFPHLPLVLDHLAKPQIAAGDLGRWPRDFREAARHEGLFCKLSGLVTEADWETWRVDDLRKAVDLALECFGPKRLMFGSDWPVVTLAAQHGRWVDTVESLLQDLTPTERSAVFGDTAARFYGIQPDRLGPR
jgi:L-fuconolactonase